MKPVANRVLDIDGAPRSLTRAETVRAWQANAKHEYHQSNYGRNPFRPGDIVEVYSTPQWLLGKVTRAAGRFEHYAVTVETEYDGALGRAKVDRKLYAFGGIRLYEARRVRALKID